MQSIRAAMNPEETELVINKKPDRRSTAGMYEYQYGYRSESTKRGRAGMIKTCEGLIYYPTSSKMMGKEIIAGIEMYLRKEITEIELRYFITHYAEHYGQFMFDYDYPFNHTLQTMFGKKRAMLILNILGSRQIKLF